MITELEIEGFKSFGYPADIIHLGRFNFLVGANASGKTNLVHALQFIQNAVLQNVEYAVNDLGGHAEVCNKIFRERKKPKYTCFKLKLHKPFSFKMKTVQVKGEDFSYCFSIDLRSDTETPKIVSEFFSVTLTVDGNKKQFTLSRSDKQIEITDIIDGNGSKSISLPIPPGESMRLAVGAGGFVAIPCLFFLEEIRSWRFFNINPNIARQSYREAPETELGKAGENLSVILHNLEKGQKGLNLESIVNGLKGVVPGFSEIRSVKLQFESKWAYQIKEEKIRGAINPYSASDGTIRLLALLVIANWVSQKSSFVAIEEPENGLHPHLAEHLVNIFRDASESCQFLITTHNPSFLDHLNPEEVLLTDKVDGITKIRKSSNVEEIDTFRKHFTLGELWIQGTLGGIP